MVDVNGPVVCVFSYNRPEKLAQTLKSLVNCIGSEQFRYLFFIDGPKNKVDEVLTERCELEIHKVFDGFNYKITKRLVNLGLRNSIIGGVNEAFLQSEQVIIVEDDLLLHPMFLPYMLSALDKYKIHSEVYQVSGFSSGVHPTSVVGYDNFFTRRAHSWGWGTWKHIWDELNWKESYFTSILLESENRKKIQGTGTDLLPMLKATLEGRISSWAVLFSVNVVLNDGVVCYPKFSLVSNKGFDHEGTNCAYDQFLEVFVMDDSNKNIKLSDKVSLDVKVLSEFYRQYSYITRFRRRLKQIYIKLMHHKYNTTFLLKDSK